MSAKLETLLSTLQTSLGDQLKKHTIDLGELTIQVKPDDYIAVCQTLKTAAGLQFEQLIDLCGVDYQEYGDGIHEGSRFAVVCHFLSVTLNQRLRVKVFLQDDDFPVLPTLNDLWSVANWLEREAFDLFGIMFEGHPDLRRLLTDYGFVGHPFRKDFPMIGHVEMRYDPEQQRVIYQPVTIDQRNNVPRVIREEGAHSG